MFRFDKEFRNEFSKNWLLIGIAFSCLLLSLSVPSYILPFVFPEVIDEFGWTREQAASIASTKFFVGALAALVVGRFIDVFGAWVLLIISTAISGAALVGFIWIDTLPMYYFVGVFLGFAGPGGMVAVKVLVSRAFHASQGTAMGIVLLGSTICSIIAPLIITYLMGALGWRYGVAAISTGVWLVVIPLLLVGMFSQSASMKHGQRPTSEAKLAAGKEAAAASARGEGDQRRMRDLVRETSFWVMAAAIFLASVADQGFKQHQVLIFKDVGMSPQLIAVGVSAIGVGLVVARVLVGNILDAKSNRGLAVLLLGLSASSLLAFYVASPVIFVLYVAMRAIGNACVTLDTTVMAKHLFGVKNLGNVLGIYTAFNSLGAAIGPWLMGRLFDTSGSYASSFLLFAVLPMIAAGLVWTVKPTFWLEQNARKANEGLRGAGATS